MIERLHQLTLFKWAGVGLCASIFFFLFYLAVSEPDDVLRLGPTLLWMAWSVVWPVSYYGTKLAIVLLGNFGWLLIAPLWALATWKVSDLVTFHQDPPTELIAIVGLSVLVSALSGWAAARLFVKKEAAVK